VPKWRNRRSPRPSGGCVSEVEAYCDNMIITERKLLYKSIISKSLFQYESCTTSPFPQNIAFE
jgi:hypothetical protein